MPEQRYERIAAHDEDDTASPVNVQPPYPIPSSPPPSFHSRASSPTAASRRPHSSGPPANDADRTLADAFDSPSDVDDSDDEDDVDDRQRLMRGQPESTQDKDETTQIRAGVQRQVTQLPVFQTPSAPAATGRVYGGGQNDGVWANLSAKPTTGEDLEEKPPSYEQAAADATPPYWETTILAPGTYGDEVYIEGMPVGTIFSFIWNAIVSMTFQIVGFFLTHLLATTHAAKNGSRAGLGVTLVQWGFTMKNTASLESPDSPADFPTTIPDDPNSHNFNPNELAPGNSGSVTPASSGISAQEWMAYALMIIGWFILIKSVSDYLRAVRHERLVLQSPDRGLGVAVVAENERPEQAV
ncbi:hypothetical protein M011DRAFT_454727 [Sporormia fimetaria CBS 119925]|uniref:Metal homeostatis protein bsd2 n=1 Tax=Sporormia fimetaria CBS 119925 TaxID=1340428 RepID=A0A6A6VQH3_9PLEO|nr:hypothetical protein M011DRAFT_454727 [Sporormia fimetaria CBS 119925]